MDDDDDDDDVRTQQQKRNAIQRRISKRRRKVGKSLCLLWSSPRWSSLPKVFFSFVFFARSFLYARARVCTHTHSKECVCVPMMMMTIKMDSNTQRERDQNRQIFRVSNTESKFMDSRVPISGPLLSRRLEECFCQRVNSRPRQKKRSSFWTSLLLCRSTKASHTTISLFI